MTTLICWFSSQLFHAVHVCFMSAIGERPEVQINLVRATPSICSPPKIDSITQRAKYPVEKYPTKKYLIENSGAKFERNGCLWCRSREIVHLSLGIDMELIQLPIIWTDVEPSNHKNYFFFIVSEQKHCQLGFGTLGTLLHIILRYRILNWIWFVQSRIIWMLYNTFRFPLRNECILLWP